MQRQTLLGRVRVKYSIRIFRSLRGRFSGPWDDRDDSGGTVVKAIIGLGNPGDRYARTRHNIGFMTVHDIVRRLNAGEPRERFKARVWETRLDGKRLVLATPMTFMNASGISVQQIRSWFKFEPEEMLIVYDDVDLEFGTVRMRERGTTGGHNGLTSIVESLGTTDIPRLRIGIGRGGSATTAHVLSAFGPEESRELPAVIERAADGALLWAREGPVAAMNTINARGTKRGKREPIATGTGQRLADTGAEGRET
jgi:peptidyl-tRNA hydrolase, PTH1 family